MRPEDVQVGQGAGVVEKGIDMLLTYWKDSGAMILVLMDPALLRRR
ncbi:hypothetical protein GCM10023238_08920 [Streptomyces heliomycini]